MSLFRFLRKKGIQPSMLPMVVKKAEEVLSPAKVAAVKKWQAAGVMARKAKAQNVFRAGNPFNIQEYDPYVGLSVTRKRKEARDWQSVAGGRFLKYRLDPQAKILRFKQIPRRLLTYDAAGWMPKDTTMKELIVYAYTHGYDAIDLEKIYGIKELRIIRLKSLGL